MRLSCVKRWVGLLLALVTSPVLAGSDTFHLGTGRDGALEVSQPDTRINRYAQVKAPLATGDLTIQVDSAEGFAAGDLVMVLQTTGLVPSAVPGSVAALELSQDAVGRWELARLSSADGDVLSLGSALLYSYAAEVSQVIRVPELTSVHVLPGASLMAQPWNGATGGVLAFLATGTVLNEGRIDASGLGFRGGSPTWQEVGCSSPGGSGEGVDSTAHGIASGPENVANGGGGGTCRSRAGGGGGNASAGGQAGQQPLAAGGMGGTPLVYSLLDHLTFGGGGGGGFGRGAQLEQESRGGRGGGAIFIRAGTLEGSGTISASGETGGFSLSEGPGGGGAGGSILLRLAGPMRCGGLHAQGGRGGASLGSSEPVSGGGGGGGRVLYQASSVTDCPISARAWLADSWSDAPEASGEEFVTALPGGLMRPEPATILWPGNGSTVETARPSIVGRATSGMEVIVYLDRAEAGRVVAADGVFSFTPVLPLSTGKHTVQAETFYQGLQSERSSLHAFVVNLLTSSADDVSSMTAASPPTVISIAGKSSSSATTESAAVVVGTARPLIVGDAEPDNSAVVKIHKKVVAADMTVTWLLSQTIEASTYKDCGPTGPCGRWSWIINPYDDLSEDIYKLEVNDTDTNISGIKTYYFKVDLKPPLPPQIASPDRQINDTTPTIEGTFGEPGTVVISIDGVQQTGETAVTASGATYTWTYTWSTALLPGDHSVQVVGKDMAGLVSPATVKVFTVDKSPPAAPVVTSLGGVPVPPNSSTAVKINTRTPGIKGSAEPFSTVVVKSGNTEVGRDDADSSGTWEIAPLATLPVGSSSSPAALSVTATDNFGNGPGSATLVSYFVDQQLPGLVVTSVGGKPVSGSMLNSNLKRPSIFGTLDEPGTVTVTLTPSGASNPTQTLVVVSPGGVTLPWKWSVDPTSDLPSSTYSLAVNADDTVGNHAPSLAYTLNIDLTPPDTTVDRATGCPALDGASLPYNFVFGVASPDSFATVSFQCSLDGNGYGPCSGGNGHAISTSLTVGTHYLSARALDAAGNVDDTPVTCIWNVSSEEFTVSIKEPPPKLSNSSSASFVLQSNRAGTTYKCQLTKDGTIIQPRASCVFMNGKVQYTGLLDGSYTLDVTGNAGESDVDEDSWTWTVDLNEPAPTSIAQPTADGVYLNTGTPRLVGRGAALGTDRSGEKFYVQIYLDGSVSPVEILLAADRSWQYTLPLLDEGFHYVLVSIRDDANNQSPQRRREFYVDTVPPETEISPPLPDRLTRTPSASFAFASSTDATGISYECLLDDATAYKPCNGSGTTSHTVSGFTGDQAHTLLVRAKDVAGNYDPTPAQFTWRVDTVPPETFIASAPGSLTKSQIATFTFQSESGATFACRLDEALEFTPCPNESFSGLSHGLHLLRVRAQDVAGNVDATPAEFKWSVDLIPPTAPVITWPEVDAVLSRTFSEVRGTAEPGSTVDVYLGDTRVGTTIANDTGLWKAALELVVSDGRYDLKVWDTDAAGNPSELPSVRTVLVDATPPDTTIIDGPSGRIRETKASFQFGSPESDVTFECSLDFGTYEPCDATLEFEVPAGEHTLRVRALDRVKNEDPSPATRVWQVYMGEGSKVLGGGLSCSTTSGGSSVLAALYLLGLAALSARRSRR